MWKYDGTNAPSMVADILPGSGGSSLTVLPYSITNSISMRTNTEVNCWSAHQSSNSDIRTGSGSSYVSYLAVFNNELYFYARDQGTYGYEWSYDGINSPSVC